MDTADDWFIPDRSTPGWSTTPAPPGRPGPPTAASGGPGPGAGRVPGALLLAVMAGILLSWWAPGWPRMVGALLTAALAAALVMESALTVWDRASN